MSLKGRRVEGKEGEKGRVEDGREGQGGVEEGQEQEKIPKTKTPFKNLERKKKKESQGELCCRHIHWVRASQDPMSSVL